MEGIAYCSFDLAGWGGGTHGNVAQLKQQGKTLNIRHRTPNTEGLAPSARVLHSMFGVGCWMVDVFPKATGKPALHRRQHDVIPLSFAQQNVAAEEEVLRGDGALRIGLADVVDVDAAAFEIFSRLAFRGRKAAVHEGFDEREARAFEFRLLDFFRGNFTEDFVEGALRNAVERAAEKNFAG